MPFMNLPDDNYLDDNRDAEVEDSVSCDLCGGRYDITGNGEGVCIQSRSESSHVPQLKLCIECAGRVAIAHQMAMQERDICEHGVVCGDWCPECNKAYKAAILDNN